MLCYVDVVFFFSYCIEVGKGFVYVFVFCVEDVLYMVVVEWIGKVCCLFCYLLDDV